MVRGFTIVGTFVHKIRGIIQAAKPAFCKLFQLSHVISREHAFNIPAGTGIFFEFPSQTGGFGSRYFLERMDCSVFNKIHFAIYCKIFDGIRNDITLAESFYHGKPVCQYAPYSRGAKDYCKLTDDIIEIWNKSKK